MAIWKEGKCGIEVHRAWADKCLAIRKGEEDCGWSSALFPRLVLTPKVVQITLSSNWKVDKNGNGRI